MQPRADVVVPAYVLQCAASKNFGASWYIRVRVVIFRILNFQMK
jgi:hypothetical protein